MQSMPHHGLFGSLKVAGDARFPKCYIAMNLARFLIRVFNLRRLLSV